MRNRPAVRGLLGPFLGLLMLVCVSVSAHADESSPATEPPPIPLWSLAESAPWALHSSPAALSPAAVAAARLDIEPTILDASHLGAMSEIHLPVFDRLLTAERSGLERRNADDFVWRGHLRGSDARVVLTVRNGFLRGAIYDIGRVYEITTAPSQDGRAVQMLLALRPELFPPCLTGSEGPMLSAANAAATLPSPTATAHAENARLPVEPSTSKSKAVAPMAEKSATEGVGGGSIDPPDDIILLGVYSADAAAGAGGIAAIEATVQAAIDVANTAFIDSNMIARFRLAHTAQTPFDEAGDVTTDLFTLDSDPTVAALRDKYGADMVGMISLTGGCGVGYVMRNPGPGFASSAFQVSGLGCSVGNLTYAHEHGHNMGFEHDPANGTSPGSASEPWSFGHFYNGNYRTVMSYSSECPNGCSRVAHFSNPDIDHNGLATGIDGERDNARTGDLTAPIITDFRLQGMFDDDFESGNTAAWSETSP